MKKIILGIAVVALIVIGSAFAFHKSDAPPANSFATKNFVYDLYPNDDPDEINDPTNYSLTGSGGTAPLDCPNGSHRCGVIAQDDGTGHPDFSQSYTPKTKN